MSWGLSVLVVGLALLGCLLRPTDAQYCTPTWTTYADMHVLDATKDAAASDSDCKTVCINNTSCSGIDWNPNNPAGEKCWWSASATLVSVPGITHYSINRTGNCSGCVPTWKRFNNTNALSGTGSTTATEEDCKTLCLNTPGCAGVDWDPANAANTTCWTSVSGAYWKNGTAIGVTHYYLDKNCPTGTGLPSSVTPPNTALPDTCTPDWIPYDNTNVGEGTYNSSGTDLTACKAACAGSPTCTGIDWDSNPQQTKRCWLSGNGQWFNGTATGVTHYQILRKTNCQNCPPIWTPYPSTNVQGGTYTAAATIDACQAACLALPSCTGIDWDPNNPQGQKCWLSGNGQWNNGTTTGITHYYLDRNTDCQNCPPIWTQYPNTNVQAGTYNTAATIDACQAACLALPSCTGIDWDPANQQGQKCWLSGNGQWFNGTATGVTHYYLNRNTDCPKCTTTWTSYPNTNVRGGTLAAATTLADCQTACLATAGCTGIDWDPNNLKGQKCWLSENGVWNNGTAIGVTHYYPNTVCSNCDPLWKSYANTNVLGGTLNAATTLDACKTACLATSGCPGLDWDENNLNGQKCWLSGNGLWMNGTANGVTHYVHYDNPNCVTGTGLQPSVTPPSTGAPDQGCTTPYWTAYPNTNVRGGTANAASTLDACKAACVAAWPGCTGIDWDPANPDNKKCWLSGNGVWNNGSSSGVTHYYLECKNCPPIWTSYPNTNVRGGTYNAAATVDDCKTACLASSSCTGIDWDPGNPDNRKCWLSGNGVWNNGSSSGVTHYYLDRNLNCAGGCNWTSYENTLVRGGTGNSSTTEDACKAACIANSTCTGIDWDPRNPDGIKCWLSGTGVWVNGTATGVRHSALDRTTCSGSVLIFRIENK